MRKLDWLDGYNGQSIEELIALERTHRTDSLVIALEQAMDQKAARLGEESLTEEERFILAIEALEHEVNNGGYGQFFVNSSREYTPVIAETFWRGKPTEIWKRIERNDYELEVVRTDPVPSSTFTLGDLGLAEPKTR